MSDEAEAILRGDRRALARGLSRVETGGDDAVTLLDALWPRAGRARRIALTGPPGVGKSTLGSALVARFRERGCRVGVIAVDPTSPFTGGALLGDRHRMDRATSDEAVFVRSMASRGARGGLARAAPAALDVLDAAGYDPLLVETVGVGQSEVEVAATADSVAVILSPEAGDALQAMKAGLLEVADVLCVNKADRPGAGELKASLESMLDLREGLPWRPPVVSVNALESASPLLEALDAHGTWLQEGGRLAARRRRGLEARLRTALRDLAAERLLERAADVIAAEAADAAAGRRSVLHAARRALEAVLP